MSKKPSYEELENRIQTLERELAAYQQMEEQLRTSEIKYKALFDVLPIGITVSDQAGNIVESNAVADKILGLSKQEHIQRKIDGREWQIVYEDGSPMPSEEYASTRALKENRLVENIEMGILKKGERIIWITVNAAPIPLEGYGVAIAYIDITHIKRTKEELQKKNRLLEKIFDILPIGLWFADKNGTLIRGNPMGVKIWGAEATVPISEYGVFEAWYLPSRKPVEPDDWALAKTIREGVTIMDELLEVEAFDGRHKTILNYTAPVLDDMGEVGGAIVVNLDISDRMALEAELAQARKMESVGRLAGGVAHDFNNMLTVILGYTQAAMDEVDPSGQVYANLREVHIAATRSADLTRQLLTFARKQMILPEVLDVNRTVDSLVNMLDRLIGEDIALVWQPADDLWPVKMDPAQINQILTSLSTNARDALRDGGTLTIETDKKTFEPAFCKDHKAYLPGDFVLLTISDTGCGMDKKTLENLFEPFYTTKDVGQGTGLGLASVYGIVQQNNGFIHVSSKPGIGTSFHIYLPRFRSALNSIAATPRPSSSRYDDK